MANERIDQKGTPMAEWGRVLTINDLFVVADPTPGVTLGRMAKVTGNEVLVNATNLVAGFIPAARYQDSTIAIGKLVYPGGTTNFLRSDGNWAAPPAAGLVDPMTSIGDIIIRNAVNTTARLAAGTEGQILRISSGVPVWDDEAAGGGGSGTVTSVSGVATNGFTWSIANASTTPAITLSLQDATSGQAGKLTAADWTTFNAKLTDPMAAVGDMIHRNGSNVTARLVAGTNGHVLTMVSGLPAWQAPSGGGGGITALTGDVTASGSGSVAATIAFNSVTDSKLRDSAGLSVIGRQVSSAGDPADIVAGGNDEVLRTNGGTLSFGTISTLCIANDAVTFAKMQNISENVLLGRASGAGTGDPGQITIGSGLAISGAGVLSATGGGGGMTDPMTTNGDIIIRAAGVAARLGIGTDGQVLTVSSGLPSWQNASSGFADPMTTAGDIIIRNAGNTTTRLAVGTTGQVLTVSGGGVPSWATPGGGGYVLPAATVTTLGGVKVSSGLDVDGDGNLIVDGVRSVTAVTHDGTHKRNDAQSMVRRDDDTLYMMYSQFGTLSGDFDNSQLAAVVSTDAGKSWSAPTLAISRGSDQSVFIPSLYRQANGDIIVIFLKLLVSLDETELWWAKLPSGSSTWGTPAKIYGLANEYYSPGSHQIVKLRNGDLIYSFCKNTSPGDLGSQTGDYVGMFLRSTDDGDTWAAEAVELESPDDLCVESGIVQFDDDSIMCYWRSRSAYVGYAISTDDLTTFGPSLWLGIRAPNSTPFIHYDEKQKALIAVYNELDPVAPTTPAARAIMLMSVSYDRGASFRQVYRLWKEEDWHFFEPTIFQNNNQWIIAAARMDNAASEDSDIVTQLVPNYFVADGDKEFVNNTVYNKVFDGVDTPHFLEFYMRGVAPASAFLFLSNQSSGTGTFSPWLKWKNFGSPAGFLVEGDISTSAVAWEFHLHNGGASVADGIKLVRIRNGSNEQAAWYGNGNYIQPASTYHNWGSTNGTLGYGFRDNAGVMEFKNSGGAWTVFNTGGGGSIDGSGTANKVTKWTDADTITDSTATDDGTYFKIPIAIIGNPASPESGWDAHFEHVGGNTGVLFQNQDNNANTNIFRCIKKRASSYTLTSGDKAFRIDAQGGVAEIAIEANTETPADNFTNLDFVWKGRQDTNFGERFRINGAGIVTINKKADGSTPTILSVGLSDVGSYLFKIDNQTSGGSGSNPWIFTKSQSNSSPGLWYNDVTATGDGWIFNTRANSGAMADGSFLWQHQNNGTAKWTVFGDGDTVQAGSITTGAPVSGTAAAWKGGVVVTTAGLVLSTTQYIQLDVNGTLVPVAVAQLP
jgi:hypothetical protein